MKKIGCLLALSIALMASAQKHYIWCPPDNISSISPQGTVLRDQPVIMVVKDSRSFSGKVENKCTPENIIAAIKGSIKAAFPNAIFQAAVPGQIEPSPREVFVLVELKEYSAHFTSATWRASTTLSVTIIDGRGTVPARTTKTIEKEKSFFNALGIITAKSNMKKCYESAMEELIEFISSTCKP